jgi:glycosyltransferase involved in cell wall biosynthesis
MFLFSIVIPTYNRLEKLTATLNNLINQTNKNFEVIIVEDGYNNYSKIRALTENLNLKYVFKSYKHNVTKKRNIGAYNSIGKYLIFLDDDDFVTNTWLSDYANELLPTKADIAFCGVIRKTGINSKIVLPKNSYSDERDWGIFLAGAFAVKKDIFDAVGGYDEILSYGENTELGFRLKQAIHSKTFIEKPNLIYAVSVNGGSKNMENIFIANNHILAKHQNWFLQNCNIHFNYLSVLGVVSFKLKKFALANQYFEKALQIKRNSFKARIRFYISHFPFIATKFWKLK